MRVFAVECLSGGVVMARLASRDGTAEAVVCLSGPVCIGEVVEFDTLAPSRSQLAAVDHLMLGVGPAMEGAAVSMTPWVI